MIAKTEYLPVFNELYDVGLSQEDLEKYITKVELLPQGFYYQFVKNNSLVTIGTRRRIHQYKSDNTLPSFVSGAGISLEPIESEEKQTEHQTEIAQAPAYYYENASQIQLHFDPITEEKKDLDFFTKILQEISNIDIDTEFQYFQKSYNSIDEIKEHFINFMLGSLHWKDDFSDILQYGSYSFSDFFEWLFEKEVQVGTPDFGESNYNFLGQILAVVRKGNTRAAIFRNGSQYNSHNRRYYHSFHANELGVIFATPEMSQFNYLDVNRYFHIPEEARTARGYGRLSDERPLPQLFFLDENVERTKEEEVYENLLERHFDDDAFLVDQTTMEMEIRRHQRSSEVEEQEEKKKETLRQKFKKRVKEVTKNDKAFEYNDVKVTKNRIEYEDQVLESHSVDCGKVLQRFARYRDLKDVNFENLSESFFDVIASKFKKRVRESYFVQNDIEKTTETYEGTIGEVTFEAKHIFKLTKNNSVMRLAYINDNRVNRDEISEILERALCFEQQEDWEYFLEKISKCSLEMHHYLDEGVKINVNDPYKDTNIRFKIPLTRKKNVNYIVINEKEYRVSNTNRLLKLQEAFDISEVINTLLNPDIVKIGGPEDIKYIIEEGQELWEQDKKMNREIIEQAEHTLDIQLQTLSKNGRRYRGYKIDGGMQTYFLDIGDTDKESFFDQCRVFSFPSMQYICMIDKSIHQTGPASIINRMYALANDKKVAREIEELNLETKNT